MKSIKKEYKDRIVYFNEDGLFHREDGPAVEYNNKTKEWYLNGLFYRTEEKWKYEVTKIKLKRILDL